MDYVLFGIQGSGKGTQGKFLAQKYDLKLFETGGHLRTLAKEKSILGKKVKKIIEAGHLVPNEVVMEIIEDFMKKLPQGKNVIFDGIPRKKEQSDSFNTLMKKLGRSFMCVLIDVSKKEAIKRLLTRRICEQFHHVYPATYEKDRCEKDGSKLITRTDDNEQSIQNRIQAFLNETMPVIKEYEKQENLIKINGEQSIENVTKEMFEKLKKRS